MIERRALRFRTLGRPALARQGSLAETLSVPLSRVSTLEVRLLRLPGSSQKILTVGCAVLFAAAVAPAQTNATPATKPTQATSASSSPSSGTATSAHKKSHKSRRTRKTANWRKQGQQKIDPQRAREIQTALIRERYLQGQSSGVWDDASEKAMQRYQADNGWQSKSTPDARALIKLGLGPDQGHLLNPESAMTSAASRPASSSSGPVTASQSVSPKAGAAPAPSSVTVAPASTAPPVHPAVTAPSADPPAGSPPQK
jgi:hypothetical protein